MRSTINRLLVAVGGPLLATATAFAQNAPPEPNISTKAAVWPGYLVAGLFAAILVVLTLFPSKRQATDL